MATIITNECINCGACEPECPNTAIYAGGVEWELNGVKHPPIAADIFYIVRDKCTECVGFFDHEACAEACPVDCCIPDSNDPEGENVLIARAKQLHPERMFAGDVLSRFRKAGAAAPALPEEAAKPAAPEPVTPAAPPPPAAPAPLAPPASPPSPAPTATAPAATAAPAVPAAKSAPAAAPAVKLAAPKPAPEPKPPTAQPATQPKPAAREPVTQPETSPAPAAAPSPAVVPVSAEAAPSVPDIQELEIPIECFHCGRTFAAPFKHFRTGTVLYCPSCHGSYVVNTSMHNGVGRALRDFHKGLCEQLGRFQAQRKKELEEFEQRQRAQLGAFNESLKKVSREFRPPGAPRERAGMFGQG
jgi:ferredoxin